MIFISQVPMCAEVKGQDNNHPHPSQGRTIQLLVNIALLWVSFKNTSLFCQKITLNICSCESLSLA